jgi:hypothetical protein
MKSKQIILKFPCIRKKRTQQRSVANILLLKPVNQREWWDLRPAREGGGVHVPVMKSGDLPAYFSAMTRSHNNQRWWWGNEIDCGVRGGYQTIHDDATLPDAWVKWTVRHVWLLWQPATSEARSRGTESYIITREQKQPFMFLAKGF